VRQGRARRGVVSRGAGVAKKISIITGARRAPKHGSASANLQHPVKNRIPARRPHSPWRNYSRYKLRTQSQPELNKIFTLPLPRSISAEQKSWLICFPRPCGFQADLMSPRTAAGRFDHVSEECRRAGRWRGTPWACVRGPGVVSRIGHTAGLDASSQAADQLRLDRRGSGRCSRDEPISPGGAVRLPGGRH